MGIPTITTQQDRLLTVNVNENPGVPIQPDGVSITPLFLDRENGVWVLYASFAPGTTLPTHFHTGTVHFFTTKGKWNYLEYPEDPQTAGSYLYEPGGSTHTFAVPPDATEPAEGFMVVRGANVNFVDGEYHSILDAGAIEELILRAVRKGYVPSMPNYIRPGNGAKFSVGSPVE